MRLGTFSVATLALALLFLGNAPAGQAFCVIAESPSALPTQVNGTQVEILLTEGHARVIIIKEFYNPSTLFKEGQIVFPLERGHELITDLRLQVGNVTYESTAVDRGKGLDEFLESIRKEKEAALVQYDPDREVYWIGVTIPPREARTTVTTLEMPLTAWDGFYEYAYRLAVDARDSVDYLRVHVRVETTSILTEVDSPSHPDLPFVWAGDHAADAYLNTSGDALSRDLFVRFRTEGRSVGQSVDPAGHRYVRWSTSVDSPMFAASQRPASRTLLFLVDGSGSMGREGRWNLVRNTVQALGGNLLSNEQFGLAVFRGRDIVPFAESLRTWSGETAASVDDFLSTFRPRGSTNLAAPLPLVDRWADAATSSGHQPVVLLISDGRITAGPSGFDLINAYSRIANEVRLPVFTISTKPLLHEDEDSLYVLSQLHGGGFAVFSENRVEEAASDLLGHLRVPVLKDVKIEFPGASDASWAVPSLQSIRRGGEIVALARLGRASSDPFVLRISWDDGLGGRRSFEETIPEEEMPLQTLSERQWVLARIHSILSHLRSGPDVALEGELTELATTYRVATPYTSLLVTVPERDRARPGTAASEALPLIVSPTLLEAEARRAVGYRRDLESALVVEGEVDVYVRQDSQESDNLVTASARPSYVGTFLTVYDVDGQLVGVLRGWLNPQAFPPQGIALAFAGLAAAAIWSLQKKRRKDEESSGGS